MIALSTALLGLALLVFVLSDVVWTTLRMRGGGPLTNAIGRGVWAVLHRIDRTFPRLRLLSRWDVLIVLATIAAWVLISWAGWLLVFASHPDAVLSSSTKEPADLWSRVYFVGVAFITLGVGDYVPNGTIFRVLSVVAAMHGFLLVTLSITYVMPILGAVISARQFALEVLSLGRTPTEMLTNAWRTGSLEVLAQDLRSMRSNIARMGQSRRAYPVLHFVSSGDRSTSSTVALVVLDEALTLLACGVEDEGGISRERLEPLRAVIGHYLKGSAEMRVEPGGGDAPPPSLDGVRRAGIPVVSDEEFVARLGPLTERRRLLGVLLARENRAWSDVWQAGPDDFTP